MGFLEEMDLSTVETIPEFYKNKTIFITGGSGFIGKVLIEKLLYSCPELDRIYLLMRSKKGVEPEDRLEKLYKYSCFDRLRKEKPGLFGAKTHVISGDVSKDGLDLSDDDRTLLTNRVNIVLHVAASVRFDDTLSNAATINVKGTHQIVELASEMKDLSAFVYVSTAYSNTNHNPIYEKMYPPVADWRDILEICDKLDSHTLKTLTTKLLGTMPNTYTFCKQLAEHIVYEKKGQMPIVIIRPSIVIASSEEPIPGWVENFNGPVGLFSGCGKGVVRSLYAKSEVYSDYIPVDYCANTIIAASWIRGVKKLDPSDDVAIYHCCSSEEYKITLKELTDIAVRQSRIIPLNDIIWKVNMKFTTCRTLHYLRVLFKQLLPAIIIDTILWLLGKKTMLVRIQKAIFRATMALEYFLTNEWSFKNDNYLSLASVIKEEDRSSFRYSLKGIDIVEYYGNVFLSARRHLFNEPDETIPAARAHCIRMLWLDRFVKVAFVGIVMWWLINKYLL